MRSFVRACTAPPMSDEDWETTLCFNIVVPPQVRRAIIFSRQIDSDDVRSEVRVPVLITHGDRNIDGNTNDVPARSRYVPNRRSILVQWHRTRSLPGGSRTLQPGARRLHPTRQRVAFRLTRIRTRAAAYVALARSRHTESIGPASNPVSGTINKPCASSMTPQRTISQLPLIPCCSWCSTAFDRMCCERRSETETRPL
jgi:hypothetical protein